MSSQIDVEIAVNGMCMRGTFHHPGRGVRAPAVVMFHGLTGLRSEHNRLFLVLSHVLASRGIASLRIDHRGRGESDGEVCLFDDGLAFSPRKADAIASLRWLQAHEGVDSKRIAVLGLSLGTAAAFWIGQEFSEEIRSVCAWSPFPDGNVGFGYLGNDDWPWQQSIQISRPQRVSLGPGIDFKGVWLTQKAVHELKNSLDILSWAKAFPGPQCVILGDEDYLFTPDTPALWQDGIGSRMRTIVLTGEGHVYGTVAGGQKAVIDTTHFFEETLVGAGVV